MEASKQGEQKGKQTEKRTTSETETAVEQDEHVIEPAGPEGYAEPRPEQKRGEGQDAGQQLVERARDELNEGERERQERARPKGGEL